ncbi:GNAT family N-acetyltransferase [Sphingomonas morindae]|uniref:GNAT family N-acetyltransferase n=1 Tax=Sphingomonas morindae TaxID=1541170 RepID=A0ABY4XBR4_9SPHN|nr:GNAT family N-acetyltransferase [Sphingomonas morindae]USI74156.1 GNAT family N-acetyltransferase [Sphingomonas morindae]
MSVHVRRAAPEDVPALLGLVRALAAYERAPDAVEADAAALDRALFGATAHAHALVAERHGRVVGMAIWFLSFSTWTGRPGLYLEDLFVEPEARGLGLGRALFAALAREAVARGCARMDWAVLDWNRPAMDFYERLGAAPKAEWQGWRLEGAALRACAADGGAAA